MLLAQILQSRGVHLEGGVVDQHIQVAQLPHCGGDRALAEGAVAHVASNDDGASSLGLYRSLGRLRVRMFTQILNRHIGAFACKKHGDCPSDARVCTRDQCDLTRQLARTAIKGRLVHRRRMQRRLAARFRPMLRRHWRRGVAARPSLHRGLGFARRMFSIRTGDLPLNPALQGGYTADANASPGRGVARFVSGHRVTASGGRTCGAPWPRPYAPRIGRWQSLACGS